MGRVQFYTAGNVASVVANVTPWAQNVSCF